MILAIVLLIVALALIGGGVFIGSLKILLWIGLAVLVFAVISGAVSRRGR